MESHSKFHGSSHHQPVIVRGVSLEVGGASGASLSWPITGCKKKNTAALFLKSPASEKYVYSVYSVWQAFSEHFSEHDERKIKANTRDCRHVPRCRVMFVVHLSRDVQLI